MDSAGALLLGVGVAEDGTRVEVRVTEDRQLRLTTGPGGCRLTPITALCLLEVLRDLILLDGQAWHRQQLQQLLGGGE